MATLPFDPPNPKRWDLDVLAKRDPIPCSDDASDGVVFCAYDHRGGLRLLGYRLRELWKSPVRRDLGPNYLDIRVDPLPCDFDELRGRAAPSMLEASRALGQDETLTLEWRSPDLVVGSTRTRRLGLARAGRETVWVDLYVGTGVREADREDFEAVLASVRASERACAKLRLGRWIAAGAPPSRTRGAPPLCPIHAAGREQRFRRAAEVLQRAAAEDPGDWRPWAKLAELAEIRARGTADFTRQMARAELGLPADEVWTLGLQGLVPRPGERTALLEAARMYAEAARREPPAVLPWPSGEMRAGDLAAILARAGRCLAEAGEIEGAREAYGRAAAEGTLGSWGVLEAALWLGEYHYRAGDRERARQLFELAERARRAYDRAAGLTRGIPRRVIERRLDQLSR